MMTQKPPIGPIKLKKKKEKNSYWFIFSRVHVEITRTFFLQKKKIFFLGQTRENKSYKSAKLLGYSPRPADLTDTGQLPITSRHYGFKSNETSNSTASSRRRRRRRRQQQPQRLLCNSHSLLILHRHICHGTYYISNYINS